MVQSVWNGKSLLFFLRYIHVFHFMTFFVEITVYVTIYVLRGTLQHITTTTKVPIYTDTSLDPFPVPNLPPQ